MHFVSERQRRFIFQPRVGASFERLPWVEIKTASTPKDWVQVDIFAV